LSEEEMRVERGMELTVWVERKRGTES